MSETISQLDFDHLRSYLGDDASLTAEVFGLFKHQTEMWQRMLIADSDDESWVSVMHSLKGSARAVGATPLAGLCEKGEAMTGARSSAPLREALIQDVKFSIEQVNAEIARWEYRQTLASLRT